MTPGEVREFFGGMDPGLGLDMGPYGGWSLTKKASGQLRLMALAI